MAVKNSGGRKDSAARPGNKPFLRGAPARAARWPGLSRLVSEPEGDFKKALELLPRALEEVWRVPRSKLKELPADIEELSRLLTRGRADLQLPYWRRASSLSAYLYYFLPWNLIRLGSLFTSLPLPKPEIIDGARPVLLDMGSGPLSLPMALWLARKDWRDLSLQVLCLDTAKQPMDVGRKLFYKLAELAGGRAWPVHIYGGSARRPLAALQNLRQAHEGEAFYPWLLAEANILNELISKSPARDESSGDYDEEDEYEDGGADCDDSLLGRLLGAWLPIWRDSPAKPLALFVEPGTRLGGDAVMSLRRCALRLGFEPLAPCVHANKCPLLNKSRRGGSQADSWCHFTFPASAAPEWLKNLSREAGLEKNSLSLSILLLGGPGSASFPKAASRVISQPFRVPGLNGEARYACGALGLELLENAARPASGTLTLARKKSPVQTDKKSGAIICEPAEAGPGGERSGQGAFQKGRRGA